MLRVVRLSILSNEAHLRYKLLVALEHSILVALRRARIPQTSVWYKGDQMHAPPAARGRARSAQVDESIPSDPISQNISVHSKYAHLTYRAFE